MIDKDFFKHFDRDYQNFQFKRSMEAMEAKAEVLFADAIETMNQIADGLVEHDEPRISMAERRAACIKVCAETFDRLEREWQARVDALARKTQ